MQFGIINSFPDFNAPGFNIEKYNKQFRDSNIIIHAKSKEIYFPEHWGGLSIKCALNGKEYYGVNNCNLAVDENNFLILNNGNYYSSHINSGFNVESFTINFTPELLNDALASFEGQDDFVMENLGYCKTGIEFYEKLYPHDNIISPLILNLKNSTKNFKANLSYIEEVCYLLIHKLILKQKELQKEVQKIEAIKASTRKELYKRLTRAKDYMDSCYNEDISIAELGRISFLNQTYFLRQFKNFFKITPRQYLINKRMQVAREQLEKQNLSITEVCLHVGYNDLSSFSKLFKQFYHRSPENFRSENIKEFAIPYAKKN